MAVFLLKEGSVFPKTVQPRCPIPWILWAATSRSSTLSLSCGLRRIVCQKHACNGMDQTLGIRGFNIDQHGHGRYPYNGPGLALVRQPQPLDVFPHSRGSPLFTERRCATAPIAPGLLPQPKPCWNRQTISPRLRWPERPLADPMRQWWQWPFPAAPAQANA